MYINRGDMNFCRSAVRSAVLFFILLCTTIAWVSFLNVVLGFSYVMNHDDK